MKQKYILLNNKKVAYRLRSSTRAKRVRLSIYHDGTFTVTCPHYLDSIEAEKFMLQKADWILEKLMRFQLSKKRLPYGAKKYLLHKERARQFIENRITVYNRFYSLRINKISIRRQRTRWGSCSEHGNLSFNYKLLFLPIHLADYIIVHELCHLKHLDHSRDFWNLVSLSIPDYKQRKKELDDFCFS